MPIESVFTYVMTQLQEHKGSWPAIAQATGLDYSWLTKVAQGKIENPGVRQIEQLAAYFEEAAREAPA